MMSCRCARVCASSMMRATSRSRRMGDRPSIWVPDIATQLELPESTTHRLLASLMSRGYVEQQEDHGTYRLGWKIDRRREPTVLPCQDRHLPLVGHADEPRTSADGDAGGAVRRDRDAEVARPQKGTPTHTSVPADPQVVDWADRVHDPKPAVLVAARVKDDALGQPVRRDDCDAVVEEAVGRERARRQAAGGIVAEPDRQQRAVDELQAPGQFGVGRERVANVLYLAVPRRPGNDEFFIPNRLRENCRRSRSCRFSVLFQSGALRRVSTLLEES